MLRVATALVALLLIAADTATLSAQNEVLGPRSAAEAAHVRGLEPRLTMLIERGMAASATFRRLVDELNASDVIVHVRHARMPVGYRGYLLHQVMQGAGVRYLRISVDARGAEVRVIGLIAHELQHALEVARVRDVGRTRPIDDYFREIADDACVRGGDCFETSAAIRIQHLVMSELQ